MSTPSKPPTCLFQTQRLPLPLCHPLSRPSVLGNPLVRITGGLLSSRVLCLLPSPAPLPVVSALEYAPPTLYPAPLSPLASDDTTVCFSSSSLCSFLDGLCGLCSSHRCLLTWERRLGAVVSWEHLESPRGATCRVLRLRCDSLCGFFWHFFWHQIYRLWCFFFPYTKSV